MEPQPMRVNLFDIMASLARVVDLMSPVMANHHMQVAYLGFRIAEAMNLDPRERDTIVIAGALHDIGAFSLTERMDLLQFEDESPGVHARAGHFLLTQFAPLAEAADIIRFHHMPWRDGQGMQCKGLPVPFGAHILHAADRIAVRLCKEGPVLGRVDGVCADMARSSGTVFAPEIVDAVLRLARRDFIWLEATSDWIESILRKHTTLAKQEYGIDDLEDLSCLLCRIIDFKSEFTATHTQGVSACAVQLAKWVGFSEENQRLIRIAANLHDLGKLAIPKEILEKPSSFTEEEWQIMRTHVYYTYRILEPLDALDTISSWGALHQERLDGSGYPFSLEAEELPVGSRIMAVADVFTAITEDRPYRAGMSKTAALEVMEGMAHRQELDPAFSSMVRERFDEINAIRAAAQDHARAEYQEFKAALASV